jgi:Alpha-L-arabinofuranosidase B (ABFB) domain/Astacin (Peptidase family M12A)
MKQLPKSFFYTPHTPSLVRAITALSLGLGMSLTVSGFAAASMPSIEQQDEDAIDNIDVFTRSQYPKGGAVTVRLPSHSAPVDLVIKGELAFLGDQVKGFVVGDRVISANFKLLAYLSGRPVEEAPDDDDHLHPIAKGSGIIKNPGLRWPGAVIPYEFDASANQDTRNAFLAAKADYDAKTVIRFVPRSSSDTHYIRVVTKSGCYSYVGRTSLAAQPQGQEMSIGNGCNLNAARHEMGHALGLAHEQVRQDRDQWVVVNSTSSQDEIDRGAAGVPIGAYDFESMMHYRNYSLGNGRWVYEPKNGFPPARVGNDRFNTFTPGDLAAIAAIYGQPNQPGGQGVTLPLGTWVSMQVVTQGFTDRYLQHVFNDAYTAIVNSASASLLKQDSSWRIVPALDGTPCYSFESRNFPNHFLRHNGFRLRKNAFENNDTFRKDATFCAQTGLAGAGGVSLVSRNFPDYYIRHRNAEVWLDRLENQRGFLLDASWSLNNAWAP